MVVAWGERETHFHKDNLIFSSFDVDSDTPPPPPPVRKNTVVYPYGSIKFTPFQDNSVKITITGTFDTWACLLLLYGHSMINNDANVTTFFNESQRTKI